MQAGNLAIQFRETEVDGQLRTFLDFHNTSDHVLGHQWRLYFSLGLKPLSSEAFTRVLLDGRYGYLQPVEGWQLGAGQSVSIEIEQWLFSGMQLLERQGFHLVRLEAEKEVLLGAPETLPAVLIELSEPRLPIIKQLSPNTFGRPRDETPSEDGDQQLVVPAVKEYALSAERLNVTHFCVQAEKKLSNERKALENQLSALKLHVAGDGVPIKLVLEDDLAADYTLETSFEQITITGKSAAGVFHGIQTFLQLLTEADDRWYLPNIAITDNADFEHRALYLDLARHFHSPAQLRKVIDAMARYKMNRLQLGLSNDEGWRIEIPSIPQLTEIGSKRSFDQFNDDGSRAALAPAWGDDHETQAGYLTSADYIALLEYARDRHIEIIPEINLPGHANALLRALEDSNYLLTDPGDTSEHQSAQGYRYNVINVAMPDTYRVLRMILKDLSVLYQFAGVPFSFLHLGGDEVPAGAWLHSTACRALPLWNTEWDIEKTEDAQAATTALLEHYVEKVSIIVAEELPQTRIGFWHEMSPVAGTEPFFNVWTTEAGDQTPLDSVLQKQQSFVICNASYLYLDMPYGLAMDEPGLPWAGYTDTRSIFEFNPIDCWQISDALPEVLGLQAQLWTETVYSEDLMDYYLFPRLLAVAERCWNRIPEPNAWAGFLCALDQRELPWLTKKRVKFRSLKRRSLAPS